MSSNYGASWKEINDGLGYLGSTAPIRCLAVSGMHLFAGIDSRGLWKRPLSDFISSVRESQKQVPNVIQLQQNYPNPFNSVTTIRYALYQPEQVNLRILNSIGQEAALLVNESKQAGEYNVRLDANDLPSGVYMYRLQAGEFVEAKKLLLLK